MGEADAIIRSTTVVDNSYNGIAISSEGRCNVEHCEIAKNTWVF
jgi:parallel beta-helix repeat protein